MAVDSEILAALIGAGVASVSHGIAAIVRRRAESLRLVPKEDAKRETMHALECFCPPKWGRVRKRECVDALSTIYRHLQYSSRGRSYLLTRASIWKMMNLLDDMDVSPHRVLSQSQSMQLYLYKTVIAGAIGNQMRHPKRPNLDQKDHRQIIKDTLEHVYWVAVSYQEFNTSVPLIGQSSYSKWCEVQLKDFVRSIGKCENQPSIQLGIEQAYPMKSWLIFWD